MSAVTSPKPDEPPPGEHPETPAPPSELVAPEPDHGKEESVVSDETQDRGLPVGQLALGATSTLTLGGWGLWQMAGPLGLAVGGGVTAAGAGCYGYYRYRQAHPQQRFPLWASRSGGRDRMRRSTLPSLPSLSHRRSAGGGLVLGSGRPGGKAGAGRRMSFGSASPARASGARAKIPSPATSTPRRPSSRHAGQSPLGRRFPLGRHTSADRHAKGAFRPVTTHHQTTPPRGKLPRAAHLVGAKTTRAARKIRRWDDRKTNETAAAVDRVRGGTARRIASLRSRTQRWAERARGWDYKTTSEAQTAAELIKGWVGALVRRLFPTKTEPGEVEQPPAGSTPHDATPPATGETDTQPTPPEPPAEKPTDNTQSTTQQGGTTTMANTLAVAASELPSAAARWETEDMMEVATQLDTLHEVPYSVARAFQVWADKLMVEYPVHEDVVVQIMELYRALSSLGANCDEIAQTFRSRHQGDITRRLAPRAGERKWNVQ